MGLFFCDWKTSPHLHCSSAVLYCFGWCSILGFLKECWTIRTIFFKSCVYIIYLLLRGWGVSPYSLTWSSSVSLMSKETSWDFLSGKTDLLSPKCLQFLITEMFKMSFWFFLWSLKFCWFNKTAAVNWKWCIRCFLFCYFFTYLQSYRHLNIYQQ